MIKVGSFVFHKVKQMRSLDGGSITLFGQVVKENEESYSIEWLDGSQTYEDKDMVSEL
jgi:hypothetical protein